MPEATSAVLLWPFLVPPKEKIEEIKVAAAGRNVVELIEVGTPYEKEGYWYIPCATRQLGGPIKREDAPIKFYEFDGRTYCLIAHPD